MIPVKVLCECGQKYSFDVEPVGGRMPSSVACPVCATDGTGAANEIIAQSLAPQTPAAPAIARKLSMPVSQPAHSAAAPASRAAQAVGELAGLSEGEKW